MVDSHPGKFSSNRLFEWAMAFAMANVGVIMAVWPSTLEIGNFRLMLAIASQRELTAFYLAIGLTRAVVLFCNGGLKIWGPRLRAILCAGSAIGWVLLGLSLWFKLQKPSVTIGILLALIYGEMRSVLRSRHDADGT